MMIQNVAHTASDSDGDPAGLRLALAVARELHAPARRAPELVPAVSRPAAHRPSAHRHTVRS
ncbi:hypothetical protein [Streptomyces sp. NBC_00645]|uniref:hypothetical protein n=1 Tax=Streptomyces sp. NBC_00645 TaxID=2975795 RepID=UPI003867B360